MSGEPDPIQRISSPTESGRLSPSPYRTRNRDEDNLLKKDKGYRRYASTVERVLSQFDTSVEEWADYITFLGRLLKALSVKPSGFQEIPHKFLVAKRLSQCLNPILPSGVHQKTLEVYSYVFSTLGKSGISADLGLYLAGLSPVLSFAALSVKPNVLTVFETYIITLQPSAIRPALKSILLALLPGLEEESSDEFTRTLKLLDALKDVISQNAQQNEVDGGQHAASEQYFWQCLFLASITSTTRRSGALAYLIRNLPHLGSNETTEKPTNGDSRKFGTSDRLQAAIDSVVSPEPGLLVRCFCAGLQDERPLIQRGFLDLLVSNLPLSSTVLQTRVIPADLERLVIAATSVVARKDMSLNRRLWSWFLGPEPSLEPNGAPPSPQDGNIMSPSHNIIAHQTSHFESFGLVPLVNGLSTLIATRSETPGERTKALRICLSLMDRWEIGGLVIPEIFLSAMSSIWLYQSSTVSPDHKHEVLRSANMFFDGVESSLIWSEVCEILTKAISTASQQPSEAQDMFEMVLFMITNFNIREEEMQTVHMPLNIVMILIQLQQDPKSGAYSVMPGKSSPTSYALKIASRLLDLIPSRALTGANGTGNDGSALSQSVGNRDVLSAIRAFYRESKGNIDAQRPFTESEIGHLILTESLALATKLIGLGGHAAHAELEQLSNLFRLTVKKSQPTRMSLDSFLEAAFPGIDDPNRLPEKHELPFAITATKVAIIEALLSSSQASSWIPPTIIRSILPPLVCEIWPSLSASRPKHNVEAVKAIWTLYNLCQEGQLIDSTIVTLMIRKQEKSGSIFVDEENARQFTTLWAHSQTMTSTANTKQTGSLRSKPSHDAAFSTTALEIFLERPLMLLLDALDDPKCSLFPFVVGWLQSLSSLMPIFDLLVRKLSVLYPIMTILQSEAGLEEDRPEDDPDGYELCYYYLQSIYNVIHHGKSCAWDALDTSTYNSAQRGTILTHQDFLAEVSIKLIQHRREFTDVELDTKYRLSQVSLALLRQFYTGPLSASILGRSYNTLLIAELNASIQHGEDDLQTSLMDVVLASIQPQQQKEQSTGTAKHRRTTSKDGVVASPTVRVSGDADEKVSPTKPPSSLLDCILFGLKSPRSRPVLENWTTFLGHCLTLYGEDLFQILLPLIGSLCDTLEGLLKQVDIAYCDSHVQTTEILDPTITILLNGLEQSLATAHDILTKTEASAPALKSPEPQQASFFGSVVGAFAGDTAKPKTLTANNRLTVLLCFKDAMKICYSIWAWGDSSKDSSNLDSTALASYKWMALRLRNRTRRIFEHLFAAEALECLETLIELWRISVSINDTSKMEMIMSLLSVLESSRPKIAMPAIFNAIYSRTNPGALEPSRTSSLTSDLSDITLATFLVAYIRALDDDAMDEIWNDCVVFLKDLLANPMPHRQTLPSLIEFTAVLGEKVDNTTFGEQRKLRRELGDLFIRLVSATLTIRPMSSTTEVLGPEKPTEQANGATSSFRDSRALTSSESLVTVLSRIVPNLSKVLQEPDRVTSITSTISNQVIAPILRAKSFPENIDERTLELVQALLNLPEASKFIKKDINDAFNDARFFSMPLPLVLDCWLPILKSWLLADKEKMPDLLGRLVSPAAAGVLGIGANSARLEADRRTQLTLRRIALLLLSTAKDTYVVNLAQLAEKLIDLLHATTTSSPSSATRGEIYMVLRALVLQVSPTHISPLWPNIHAELFEALSSSYPSPETDNISTNPILTPTCLLQACKLLDTLLVLDIDDFQMQAWLFISDTTDAVYRPSDSSSVALVDDLALALDQQPASANTISDSKSIAESQSSSIIAESTTTKLTATASLAPSSNEANETSNMRRPLLTAHAARNIPKDQIMDQLVRPFFRQLSIAAFESTYGLQIPDQKACFDEVLADLFDDSTIVF